MNNLKQTHIDELINLQSRLSEKIKQNFEILMFEYNPESGNYRLSIDVCGGVFFAFGKCLNDVIREITREVNNSRVYAKPVKLTGSKNSIYYTV